MNSSHLNPAFCLPYEFVSICMPCVCLLESTVYIGNSAAAYFELTELTKLPHVTSCLNDLPNAMLLSVSCLNWM
jgi:hypothetical protein